MKRGKRMAREKKMNVEEFSASKGFESQYYFLVSIVVDSIVGTTNSGGFSCVPLCYDTRVLCVVLKGPPEYGSKRTLTTFMS